MATYITERSTYWVVSGGSNPSAYGDYRYYWKIYYDQSESTSQNNRSKVVVEYFLQTHKSAVDPDTGWDTTGYPSGTCDVKINGSSIGSIWTASGTIMIGTSWALTYLGTKSTYVTHNENGTGSFTFQGSGFGKATSVSTYSLPTIARGSTLGTINNFTADTGVTIPITQPVSSYYNRLRIYQNVNGTNTLIKTVDGITNGTTVTFTSAELDTIYTNTPIASSTFKFDLLTYTTNAYTTQVGSTSSKTATCNLVINTPSFSAFTYADSNGTTTNLTRNNQKIVKGYSTLKITLTSAQRATANTRQTSIAHYIVNGETVPKATIEGSNGYSIENYNLDNVTLYAVDTRGFSSPQITYSFANNNKFVNYIDVAKDTEQSYTRSNNGIGKYLDVTFSGIWWSGNFGNTNNVLAATYKYKKSGDSQYTPGVENLRLTVGSASGQNTFSYSGRIKGDPNNDYGFDIAETYDIIITVSDKLSHDTITFNIHAGEPAIAIYKNKAAFGAQYDETLGGTQIWGNAYLNGESLSGVNIDMIYPVGSIYITVDDTFDPNTAFTGTTWVPIEDRFLLAAGSTYSNGSTGGSATVTLTTDQIPSHRHLATSKTTSYASGSQTNWRCMSFDGTNADYSQDIYTGYTGGGQAHENMPPYLAVCVWKRTA